MLGHGFALTDHLSHLESHLNESWNIHLSLLPEVNFLLVSVRWHIRLEGNWHDEASWKRYGGLELSPWLLLCGNGGIGDGSLVCCLLEQAQEGMILV